MLNGLESGLGRDLFDGERSIEYQVPRLLELNLADGGVNCTTGCRFEVGLKAGPGNRQGINNIPDANPVGSVGLDHSQSFRHQAIITSENICRTAHPDTDWGNAAILH